MSGKKGRSGRLPRAIELQRARGKDDALSCVRRRLPQILEVLVQKAEAGDKECAIYCADRVLGRPRQELDQRLRAEVIPNASQYLAFMRTPEYAEALAAAQRESKEIEAEWSPTPWPERELSDSTRDISHDPDVVGPICEETISQTEHCANSTDSVGIPPEDRPPAWLDGAGI